LYGKSQQSRAMPSCGIIDIHHVVQRQEALIAHNRTSIFTSRRRMHDWLENHGNGLVVIMETMLQQKRQIENVDVKCNVLSH